MRRRRAVADPDELCVVGTAAARWIREKQHDTDPNRRRRRRALARSLPGVKVCCGRPPSRAVTSVRRRRAHLHTRAGAEYYYKYTHTYACVRARVGGVRCATGRYALSDKKRVNGPKRHLRRRFGGRTRGQVVDYYIIILCILLYLVISDMYPPIGAITAISAKPYCIGVYVCNRGKSHL